MACNLTEVTWWPGNTPLLGRPCADWQSDWGCPESAASACDWAWGGNWPCFAGETRVGWIRVGNAWRAARRTGPPCTPASLASVSPLLVVLTLLLVVAGLAAAHWLWRKRQPLHVIRWQDLPEAYAEAERDSESE